MGRRILDIKSWQSDEMKLLSIPHSLAAAGPPYSSPTLLGETNGQVKHKRRRAETQGKGLTTMNQLLPPGRGIAALPSPHFILPLPSRSAEPETEGGQSCSLRGLD